MRCAVLPPVAGACRSATSTYRKFKSLEASREAWYELAEYKTDGETTLVQIRVNLAHPFMVRFIYPDGDEIVPFTRLAAGLAIAEITAREVGVRQVGTLRMNLNQILRSALSGPVQRGEARNGE